MAMPVLYFASLHQTAMTVPQLGVWKHLNKQVLDNLFYFQCCCAWFVCQQISSASCCSKANRKRSWETSWAIYDMWPFVTQNEAANCLKSKSKAAAWTTDGRSPLQYPSAASHVLSPENDQAARNVSPETKFLGCAGRLQLPTL